MVKDLRHIIWCQTGWCWCWYTAGGGGLANITVDLTVVSLESRLFMVVVHISETLCKLLVSPHPQDTSYILTVTNVYSGIGEVIQIAGIRSDTNLKLNDTFRVTATPDARSVSFASLKLLTLVDF